MEVFGGNRSTARRLSRLHGWRPMRVVSGGIVLVVDNIGCGHFLQRSLRLNRFARLIESIRVLALCISLACAGTGYSEDWGHDAHRRLVFSSTHSPGVLGFDDLLLSDGLDYSEGLLYPVMNLFQNGSRLANLLSWPRRQVQACLRSKIAKQNRLLIFSSHGRALFANDAGSTEPAHFWPNQMYYTILQEPKVLDQP